MPLHVPTSSKNNFFSFFLLYVAGKQWKNKKKKKKTDFSKKLATRTYLKLIFISFFSYFLWTFPLLSSSLIIQRLEPSKTGTILFVGHLSNCSFIIRRLEPLKNVTILFVGHLSNCSWIMNNITGTTVRVEQPSLQLIFSSLYSSVTLFAQF